MRVANISSIVYGRKIIDSHSHIGRFGENVYKKDNLDIFVSSKLPNDDEVEKMFVSSTDVLTTEKAEYAGNREVLNIFEKSDKYKVFASCSPVDGNVDNIKRLYKDFPDKFIGLKFHPTMQNLDIADERYEPYMKFADKQKIPCVFHCAVAVDNSGKLLHSTKDVSDPEFIYKLAQKHNKTPIVMAHLGAGHQQSHDKAIDILVESIKNGDANLYADISWVDIGLEHNGQFYPEEHRSKEHVLRAIKKLKGIGDPDWKYGDQSYRLMFGSDAPIDRYSGKDAIKEYTTFVEDIKYAIRNDNDLKADSEKIIDDLFYNNAEKLFLKKKSFNTAKFKKILLPVFLGLIVLLQIPLMMNKI